jgi:inner membrane protein involved in colicin E2 resistance
MPRGRGLILAIGLVIAAPLIFAALGATQRAGLIVGVVLVVVGIGASLAGSRRADDGGE